MVRKVGEGNNDIQSIQLRDIPQGMYFTGTIGKYEDARFFRGYNRVISLSNGDTWDYQGVEVRNYVPCDAQIKLTPINQ